MRALLPAVAAGVLLGDLAAGSIPIVGIAATYARDPKFYGATFCINCRMHRPVGPDGEFVWDDGTKVGA